MSARQADLNAHRKPSLIAAGPAFFVNLRRPHPRGQGGSVRGYLSQYRPFLPHAPLVGLELPAGELVPLALCRSRPGGAADHPGAGLHRRRLCRSLEQALALRRRIRSQIGVTGFVAYRGDHVGAARGLGGGFLATAFKTTVETEFGSLDVFVSNARTEASTFYQPPMEITLDKWDTARDSQAKAFLVGVPEGEGGRIIAITFAPGGRLGSCQPWVAMGTAKAAMEVLIRYFAVALAGRGITVNTISPDWIKNSVLDSYLPFLSFFGRHSGFESILSLDGLNRV